MNISNASQFFLVSFCISLFSCGYSQGRNEKKIDSLQAYGSVTLREKGEYQKLILLNQQMVKESKKIKYDKGITRGYIKIANALLLLGNNKESLQFLKLAEKEDYLKHDDRLSSELYIEYSRNYEVLGFYKKADQCLDKAIYYGRKINAAPNYALSYAYSYKAVSNNIVTKFPDSVLYYLHKTYKIEPSPLNAGKISFGHINNNRLDSAEYYIKKAWNKAITQPDLKYQKASVLWGMGNVYFAKKEYAKAIEYYQQSFDIYKQMKRKDDMRALYQMISNSYDSLGEPKKTQEYLAKYMVLNDSLNKIQKQVVDVSVTQFLEEQEQQNQSTRQKLYYIIGSIVIIGILAVILGFIFYKKKNKMEQLKIQNLEKKINITSDEVIQLEQRVNAAHKEIMQLAKNDDPAFLGRFREVYPEFCDKLLKINPGLVNSELKFCALLSLNLSTKEIATYTFVQPGAVRIRKNRMRKKLNIPSDLDINIWMNNIVNGV